MTDPSNALCLQNYARPRTAVLPGPSGRLISDIAREGMAAVIVPVTAVVLRAAVNKENPMTDTPDLSCLLNHTMAHSPPPLAGAPGPAAAMDLTGETAPPAEGLPVVHTIDEVARTLGVSCKTIARRIRDGVIHKAPMGGRLVRISSAELQRLAAGAPFRPRVQGVEVSMSSQVLGQE
jgi:excisionase family DNA binding protein